MATTASYKQAHHCLLVDRAGESDAAMALYERALNTSSFFAAGYEASWCARALHRLGELYEAFGHRDQGIEYVLRSIELWRDADPEL